MRGTVVVIAGIALLIFVSGGLNKTGDRNVQSPPRKERPEYNCLHHAPDGICEVPMRNGKVVLYCVKGPVKKVVRYREDCK